MEEVFEVYFDFNKAVIKPEYAEVIKKLAKTTQENRNVKVSVVGHTDTKGSKTIILLWVDVVPKQFVIC